MMDADDAATSAPYGLGHPLEEMFSINGTRALLMFLHDNPGCTRQNVRERIFDGKRRDRAFRAVIENGMVGEDDLKRLWLTAKGRFMVRIFKRVRIAEETGDYRLLDEEEDCEIEILRDEYQLIQYAEKGFWDIIDFTTYPHPSDFIYRGQGNSRFRLVPSLYREGQGESGRPSGAEVVATMAGEYIGRSRISVPSGDSGEDLEFCEIAALLWFYDMANKQCLPLPEIPRKTLKNEYLDVMDQRAVLTPESYIREWSGLAAIAQHYGVPTRMLDWTFDVNVALYFAVKDLPEAGEAHPEFVSLWILDKTKMSIICDKILFVMPEYSENPNIGAQSGLFSILTEEYPGEDLEAVIIEAYRNASLETRSSMSDDGVPILMKYNIPYEVALWIKRNFKDRGINNDSVFPGFSGIVESMKIQSGVRKARCGLGYRAC